MGFADGSFGGAGLFSNSQTVPGATPISSGSGGGGNASLSVSWALPTKDADGSALATITNQTIYYDTVSRMGTGLAYTFSTSVGNGVDTSKTISGLNPGLYYIALTATTAAGESDLGMEFTGTAI